MAGTDSDAPLHRLQELEEEIQVLRERLEQADEDNDRLRREIERLRRELKAAGRGESCRKRKLKADPQRPGRKAGQGRFTFRQPPDSPDDPGRIGELRIEVPVPVDQCPGCGGKLQYERTEEATVTDLPPVSAYWPSLCCCCPRVAVTRSRRPARRRGRSPAEANRPSRPAAPRPKRTR